MKNRYFLITPSVGPSISLKVLPRGTILLSAAKIQDPKTRTPETLLDTHTRTQFDFPTTRARHKKKMTEPRSASAAGGTASDSSAMVSIDIDSNAESSGSRPPSTAPSNIGNRLSRMIRGCWRNQWWKSVIVAIILVASCMGIASLVDDYVYKAGGICSSVYDDQFISFVPPEIVSFNKTNLWVAENGRPPKSIDVIQYLPKSRETLFAAPLNATA